MSRRTQMCREWPYISSCYIWTLMPFKTTYNKVPDDGDCTTAITCSECGVIVTAAKTHIWDTVWSKDVANHWKEYENANYTQVKDAAAHTPGDWVTDQAATETVESSKR